MPLISKLVNILLLTSGFLELTLFELNILHLCGFDHFQFIFFLVSLIIFISSVCRGRGREREEVKGGGGAQRVRMPLWKSWYT